MKRFAAVAVFGLGLFIAGFAEAAKLPQGESMVGRMRVYRGTHPASAKVTPTAPRLVAKLGQFRPPHPIRGSGR